MEKRVLAVMVTREEGGNAFDPDLYCPECVEDEEGIVVEAVWYHTVYTFEHLAGRHCIRCRRTLGEVVMTAHPEPWMSALPDPAHNPTLTNLEEVEG